MVLQAQTSHRDSIDILHGHVFLFHSLFLPIFKTFIAFCPSALFVSYDFLDNIHLHGVGQDMA